MTEPNNLANNFINLLLYEHVDGILENTAANVYMKDNIGKYLAVNTVFEKISGIKSREIIGHDDFDLFASSQADTFRKHDALILTKEVTNLFFERTISQIFLSYKTPLKNRLGKTIGVLGFSFLCENSEDLSLATCNPHPPLDIFSINSSIRIQRKEKSVKKILTLRQYDCLYYLIKGMSAKQIANTLGLSCRTVEDHISRLKEKFNCNTRFDLVSHALKIPYIKNKLFLDLQNAQ